jgi:hypothetical protein
MADIEVELAGFTEMLDYFAELPRKVAQAIERKAMVRACRLILKDARAGIKQNITGMLAESLAYKIVRKDDRIIGIVGPRKGTQRIRDKASRRRVSVMARWKIKAVLKSSNLGNAGISPSRYAHLVEKGHARGRGTAAAPSYHWLQPAIERNQAAIANILAEEIFAAMARA